MARSLWVCLLLSIPLLSHGSSKAKPQFAKGNEWYSRAKYKDAVSAYQQILDSGYVSAEVYYNLGNAYYKLGEMSLAIWNYEKAYQLSPGDEDIQTNIQFANLKIRDKMDKIPEFFLTRWWRSLVFLFSSETLSVIGAVAWISGFGLLIVYLFSGSIAVKRPAFYAGAAVILLGVVLTALAGFQNSYLSSSRTAIVVAGTVNVKSGPKERFKSLYVIHEGLKVTLKERIGDWSKVELPNGNTGWIKSADFKEI